MEYLPLVIIAIVILTGVIALAMGFRGWSIANTVGAWLVLLAACGFLALAGIRGQSERAWTSLVRAWESKVLQVRDAMRLDPKGGLKPIGECSLESPENCAVTALETKRAEWSRALERVESWRGRFWEEASFDPPRPDPQKPGGFSSGKITIESEANPSIAVGAELYVFDRKPPEEGGRFLGGFRVTKVDQNTLTVDPLARVDDHDKKLWGGPHGEVAVYENLPFDRWIAFHRTDRAARPTVLPEPSKRLPGEGAAYEPLRTELERHTFPEDLFSEEAADDGDEKTAEDADAPPPGVEWATVTFENDFEWKPEGVENADGAAPSAIRYRAGEKVSAFPANRVAALRKAGATFSHVWSYPPGVRWAEVEFEQDKTFDRPDGETIEFSSGTRARLPLEDAENLVKDGVVSIKRRLYRRPLAAASTAFRGVAKLDRFGKPVAPDAADGLDVQSLGLYRVGGLLEQRIAELRRNKTEMDEADAAARRQHDSLASIKERLEKDLVNWSADAAAADALAAEADRRLASTSKSLDETERRIIELGSLLKRLSATLATEVGRRAPPVGTPTGG